MGLELVIVLVCNAALIGSAWGHLRSGQNRNGRDIESIKKSLGLDNGHPSAFVRREEFELERESQDDTWNRIDRELQAIWSKVNNRRAQ